MQHLTLAEYPRLDIAKACDVRTSFTVPFVVCGVVLAVCEFVTKRQLQYDPDIIQDIKKALSEALQLKVHLGLNPWAAGRGGRRRHVGTGEQSNQKEMEVDAAQKYRRSLLPL